MKKLLSIVTTFLFLAVLSCTKHKDDIEDTAPTATVQFFEPTMGSTFKMGDSVSIQALAVSAATIHGYDLVIRKAKDTTKLYFKHVHDHNDTIQVNRKWKADISNATLEAELVFYLDHDGHIATKKAGFQVQ